MRKLGLLMICVLVAVVARGTERVSVREVAPGVTALSTGKPDAVTPYSLFGGKAAVEAMQKLPAGQLPFSLEELSVEVTPRGCRVEVPLADDEQLYGFGLQFDSFGQRGLRRHPVVNDNPLNSLGYSHAPQPFYVSTAGYGILVNTARYTTFLCGSNQTRGIDRSESRTGIATDTGELYRNRSNGNKVYIDIPGADGVEVFVIYGPSMRDVVCRYNLLSGGGALPPMWGLGFKYRVKADATQDSVMRFARYFREKQIPCDVIGLEPGWQTAAYSCSYVWSPDRFPRHREMLSALDSMGFRANLWEHAYVHPSAPFRKEIEPYSGDFTAWNGVVPDFTTAEARSIFCRHHAGLADDGVACFKLDECDNSNRAYGSATWCFPDMAQFPSGLDGEQMHQLFGSLYVRAIDSVYRARNLRAYHDYRSSGLFMSDVPGVLYSDSYNHKEYVQALCNASFGGLLWCPEVREASSAADFFHRLQTCVLSPQAMVNAWYLQYPPWLQFDRGRNERGEFLAEAAEYEAFALKLVNHRMMLLPYLYSAFAKYHTKGLPPFRPLVMDYPADLRTREISDQYMIGEGLMAAPLVDGRNSRKVYFPEGEWYNFNTGEKYAGGKEYEVATAFDELPLYVRSGTLLPLAEPVQHVGRDTLFNLNCRVYGAAEAACTLFEDDGESYDFTGNPSASNIVTLTAAKGKVKLRREGKAPMRRYKVASYTFIP